MLRITTEDGKHYEVVTWHTFKLWVRRNAIAYAILAAGLIFGVWALTVRSDTELINKINTFATESCKTAGRGNVMKFNAVIDDLIKSRTVNLNNNLNHGNANAAKEDQAAISRYQGDYLHVPTIAECEAPILKR